MSQTHQENVVLINEPLPAERLHAEVVMHVRRHLRHAIRHRTGDVIKALQLLFGLSPSETRELRLEEVVDGEDPIQATAARLVLLRKQTVPIVSLAHDAACVEQYRQWLLHRKAHEPRVFEDIVAFDLGTLLALSIARDVANLPDRLGHAGAPEVPILITGPTGTGKELLARAIHALWVAADKSARKDKELKPLFVAGFPKDLVNDELFGHVKGAFTDARQDRIGRLEEADAGSLLIDEIGDLAPDTQIRLLRFLDTGETTRTGSNRGKQVRIRVIAATLKDLEREVVENRFRPDLLHRLGATRITLPALCERGDPSTEVVPALLERARPAVTPQITCSAMGAIRHYDWPGNLRELRHVLNIALASAGEETIGLDDLPSHVRLRYLSLPYQERAADLLCDATRRQPLSTELVRYRAKAIQARLESLPLTKVDSSVRPMLEFLQGIPDDAREHQELIARVRVALERENEVAHILFLRKCWSAIRRNARHALATAVADDYLRTLRERQQQAAKLFRKNLKQLKIEENPWWKLLHDMQKAPLLQGWNMAQLLPLYNLILRIILTLPENVREKIKEAIRLKRGLRDVWRELALFLGSGDDEEEHAEDEQTQVSDAIPPRRRPKEFWFALAEVPTLAEASRQSGYDGKTIRQYLKKHKIIPTWSMIPENGSSASSNVLAQKQSANKTRRKGK